MAHLASTPTLMGFSPDVIPYQRQVIDLIKRFDYAHYGVLEILLSGSFGSAKSTLLAHLAVRHCLKYKRARVCIARKAMPDLKRTLWKEILEHIEDDLVEGKDYWVNLSDMIIKFRNKSEIICASWNDKRYMKFRSLKISMLIVEEIVENKDEDKEAYNQLFARLGRLPHIKENISIAATNPGDPDHWVHKHWIEPNSNGADHPTRYVFYSNTTENPFLPETYVQGLLRNMTPKEVERYIKGRWLEIRGQVIYYAYDSEAQFFRNKEYVVREDWPIILSFDFNIAEGKPMSAVMVQHDLEKDTFHYFNQAVIEGARTEDIIEDWYARKLLDPKYQYIVAGDASGKHKSTTSKRSDYDIIIAELGTRGIKPQYWVPSANPPIRKRHNTVNRYCKNGLGQVRLFVYASAPTLDEALRLTKLKKGADYIEDDSKAYQHIGTAGGYAIVASTIRNNRSQLRSEQL